LLFTFLLLTGEPFDFGFEEGGIMEAAFFGGGMAFFF
jgi:hypothetical protein